MLLGTLCDESPKLVFAPLTIESCLEGKIFQSSLLENTTHIVLDEPSQIKLVCDLLDLIRERWSVRKLLFRLQLINDTEDTVGLQVRG